LKELFVFYNTLLNMGDEETLTRSIAHEDGNKTVLPVISESKILPVSPRSDAVDTKGNGQDNCKTEVVSSSVVHDTAPMKTIKKGRRFTRNKRQFKKKFVVEPTAERENCANCGNLATPMYTTNTNWM
jgi:hypothetical protein